MNYTPLKLALSIVKTDKTDIIKKEEAEKTKEKKRLFLECLSDDKVAGNVLIAAKNAGVNRQYMYELRAEDETFREDWDKVVDRAKIQLRYEMEYSLRKEGLAGNVTAAIFILKNVAPELWNDKYKLEGTGIAPVTNNTQININQFDLSIEVKEKLNAEYAKYIEAKYE